MKNNNFKIVPILPVLIALLAVFIIIQRENSVPDPRNAVNSVKPDAAEKKTDGKPQPPEENEPVPTSSPHLFLYNFDGSKKIESPLVLRGLAAGWYFEGSFPVELLDESGAVIAQTPATALDDWMTTKFVPFKVELTFTPPSSLRGTLVLKKDNPSGDPSFDEKVEIPVVFAGVEASSCRPTGCSGQICADHSVISTCEYRDEYACYETAKCERQSDGECGWTETPELASCLAGTR